MYMNTDQLMIEKQAQIITQLRTDIKTLRTKVATLEQYNRAAEFYLEMQRAILASPSLQSEWTRFLAIAKLNDAAISDREPENSQFDLFDEPAVK